MLRFLGFMDLIAGLLFAFIKLGMNEVVLTILFWISVVYIIFKLISFSFSFGALGDAVSLIILFFSFFSGFGILSWVGMIWFIQKGILSLID